MRTFKRVLLAFVVIFLLLLGIGFLLPREVHVERSTTIAAPAEVVFALTNDLHENEKWTPWGKDRDPTIQLVHGGAPKGKGAWYTWESEQLGAGRLEIVDSQPPTLIEMQLAIRENGGEPAQVVLKLTPIENNTQTIVTWSRDMDMGFLPPGRYFGLFMDKVLSGDFEQGLANLKRVAESQSGAAN